MSTSIAILKILSAYSDGSRASVEALKADLAVLSSREWLARIRALAAACGPVHLFSDGLVIRDDSGGWAITAKGRTFLDALDKGVPVQPRIAKPPELRVVGAAPPVDDDEQQLSLQLTRISRAAG